MRCLRCGVGWNPSELGLVAALLGHLGVLEEISIFLCRINSIK